MFGEKENYKYLEISEAGTVKYAEMIEKKIRKEYLRRTRKLLKTKLRSKISSKGWIPLKMDEETTLTNGPKDKKIDDNAQSFTSKRWHRYNISVNERKMKLTREQRGLWRLRRPINKNI